MIHELGIAALIAGGVMMVVSIFVMCAAAGIAGMDRENEQKEYIAELCRQKDGLRIERDEAVLERDELHARIAAIVRIAAGADIEGEVDGE